MFNQHIPYTSLSISLSEFKHKALQWAQRFNQVAYYEHNNITFPHGGFSNFLAVSDSEYIIPDKLPLEAAQAKLNEANEVLCCILSYELKNVIEPLNSRNLDTIQFPKIHFFNPEVLIKYESNQLIIITRSIQCNAVIEAILKESTSTILSSTSINIKAKTSKSDYIRQVEKIKQRIQEGDVYELNYCQNFFAEEVNLDPVSTFISLNEMSPMPFAGFYKVEDKYLLCASPERFLKRTGNTLVSQPIKGTIRRGKTLGEDAQLKQELATSEKEIAENMMIMDLVRNDLARCSKKGSVQVEEMFKIYTFRQVHQMITSIRSEVAPASSFSDILRATFPMGSMTGAPKIQAMRLIDQHEAFARGLFSGSLGYILPNGDFDFNVVIRSIQYNKAKKYLSFAVGSAITYDADPEKEYEECILKATAIVNTLQV